MSLEPTPQNCLAIAKLFGAQPNNVTVNYPLLHAALTKVKCGSGYPLVIALATVGVENRGFDIIRERGSQAYFIEHYWSNARVAKNLGNKSAQDAYTYCGRGLLQITGRYNYDKYGKKLKLDLIGKPDLALDRHHAMDIFAAYFQDHGIDVHANKWAGVNETSLQKCRKLVNGGLNGYDQFKKLALALLKMEQTKPGPPPIVPLSPPEKP